MRDAINAGLRPTNHTDLVVAPLDQMMMLHSAVDPTAIKDIHITQTIKDGSPIWPQKP